MKEKWLQHDSLPDDHSGGAYVKIHHSYNKLGCVVLRMGLDQPGGMKEKWVRVTRPDAVELRDWLTEFLAETEPAPEPETKIGYKWLRRGAVGILRSPRGGPGRCTFSDLGLCWTKPLTGCGPITVFKTEKHAQGVRVEYPFSGNCELWRVEYVPSAGGRLRDGYPGSGGITIDLCYDGTVFAERVRLLECVDKPKATAPEPSPPDIGGELSQILSDTGMRISGVLADAAAKVAEIAGGER